MEYSLRDEQSSKGLIELIQTIGPNNNKKMIEIGSFVGESTVMFADSFGFVISIDPFLSGYDNNDTTSCLDLNYAYDEFIKRTSKYNNIKNIKLTSDDAIDVLRDEIFDFVYIDGLHTYEQVKMDIINYKPLIKTGGVIGGHDYHSYWSGVINAVDELLGKPDKTFSDGSWIKYL